MLQQILSSLDGLTPLEPVSYTHLDVYKRQLDDRLRGNLDDLNPNLFYQITMTFNPVSATHWIKARYFDKADPDVLTHHSTYKKMCIRDRPSRVLRRRTPEADRPASTLFPSGDRRPGRRAGHILFRRTGLQRGRHQGQVREAGDHHDEPVHEGQMCIRDRSRAWVCSVI